MTANERIIEFERNPPCDNCRLQLCKYGALTVFTSCKCVCYLGVLSEVLLTERNQVVDRDLSTIVHIAHLEHTSQQLADVVLL